MQRVMRWRVDEPLEQMVVDHVPVVDQDRPQLDEDEEDEVGVLVHGADEDEDAAGYEFSSLAKVPCMTHWYGRDCAYPSTGWKARADQGVGTDTN